jgi:predicted secreted hydrolase
MNMRTARAGRNGCYTLSQLTLLVALFLIVSTATVDAQYPTAPSPVSVATPVSDAPERVTFPAADGPHRAQMEWWYYTGRLVDEASDNRYGFELVAFKSGRMGLTGYVAHFAITDTHTGRFQYEQRTALAPRGEGAASGSAPGFDISVGDWRMSGSNGADSLKASMDGYAIDLTLSTTKPPAIHDGDGFIDYGEYGGSYYYSRTRIVVSGKLAVDGKDHGVTGQAWFDHQWGDFTTYSETQWDWFGLQLDNDTEVMLYLIRSPDGTPVAIDGSIVDPSGEVTILQPADLSATASGTWSSPHTGVTYPSGWKVGIPAMNLKLAVEPVMPDQELDTKQTTGLVYWEGEVTVDGMMGDQHVSGFGYVELNGYADLSAGDISG